MRVGLLPNFSLTLTDRPELQQLSSFRAAIEAEHLLAEDDSLGTDNATLTRFLRARQFKVDRSMHMLRECLNWRRNVCGHGMDKLYETVVDPFDYPERAEVAKLWPLWFHKTDRV